MAADDGNLNVVARARRAAEALRASSRTIEVLRDILPETDEGHDLMEWRDRLTGRFNKMVLLEGQALDDEVRRLESEVWKLELAVDALDREIPMPWFRAHFDATHTSSVALADYAKILGRHVDDSPLRLDRIQFILTRVVSFFIRAEDATPTRRRELLAEALPPVEIDDETRTTAVAFLRDAAKRVAVFEKLKQVIESGFFMDVRGYKLSLRDRLLDPEVMAAAIELNEAINDNLRRLAEADRSEDKEFEAHLAEVDERLKSMFKQLRNDEAASQEKFERWLERNAKKRSGIPQAKGPYKPLREPSKYQRSIALGVVLAILCGLAWWRWPSETRLTPLGAEDLKKLSPMLVSGTVAPPDTPRVFIGQVDKSKWALAPLSERRTVAEGLAVAIAKRGWFAATVMMENQVVVQIENGKLLVVQ